MIRARLAGPSGPEAELAFTRLRSDEAGIMPDDDREPMQTREEHAQQLHPFGDRLGRGQR
jgi:hypothetical protein